MPIKFNELNKGDIFIFTRNEGFGTLKVANIITDFNNSKIFKLSLPDRSEIIINKSDGHIYNSEVTVKSAYKKRCNKNKHKHKIKYLDYGSKEKTGKQKNDFGKVSTKKGNIR